MTQQKIGIHFGVMCQKISKQVTDQGFQFQKDEDADYVDTLHDAYNRVRIAGVFTDSECERARSRLMKIILDRIAPVEA